MEAVFTHWNFKRLLFNFLPMKCKNIFSELIRFWYYYWTQLFTKLKMFICEDAYLSLQGVKTALMKVLKIPPTFPCSCTLSQLGNCAHKFKFTWGNFCILFTASPMKWRQVKFKCFFDTSTKKLWKWKKKITFLEVVHYTNSKQKIQLSCRTWARSTRYLSFGKIAVTTIRKKILIIGWSSSIIFSIFIFHFRYRWLLSQ